MNRKPSPNTVRGAVNNAVWAAVHDTVPETLSTGVYRAVWSAVDGAVYWAARGTFLTMPIHPRTDRFVEKIRQTMVGST